ncbi:transcriptional regulator [Cereibacter changlensis JA139]|uniref:Transcriptional regulator n=2 Tax=Cereibacter changlensis TaxID=402884 RepID=A0A2T4JX29_9RHOB|nr:Crp/Fnr family transcriptional regulator [Cereibacter changlensis]PTE22479.1 transcriptional regulator [Cereibacter changlensis JA139]PZX48779.1 CRP/FNR family transcriptional regulator [Cereibacter changlensis]
MMLQTSRLSMDQCKTCPIGASAICARCDSAEMRTLESVKFYRRFQAGQTIVYAGDRMDFVASIVSGVATLNLNMEDGRRQMVGLLLPADFIGRPGRTVAAFDLMATTDMLMCCFRRKPFEDLLLAMPHLNQRLLEMTLDELDAARDWMLLLGRKTAREKVATLLIMVMRRTTTRSPEPPGDLQDFEVPLSRVEMADFLGMTEETVSRQMSSLRRDGVIGLSGIRRVQVADLPQLVEVAGDDADGGLVA